MYRIRMTGGTAALALALLIALSSCSTIRGWTGKDRAKRPSDEPVVVIEDTQDNESGLREAMRRYMDSESGDEERVLRKRPYYLKEYSEYASPDTMDIEIQEQDSRTAPYIADVKIHKVRYATRMHRKREEARADTNIIRDTGVESVTFELRNGRWTRLGSLFDAEESEENVNGEWVPLRRDVAPVVAEEEPAGWFGRTWSRVFGGN